MKKKLKESIQKAAKSLYMVLPIIIGVVLLVSLANTFIPKTVYASVFTNNTISDSLIGSGIGSVLAGNPITSYIIGGELLKQGVSLVAVTAFIFAWVTVGVVQFPAEAILLGRKFAITRNITAFIFAIFAALITVAIMGII